MADFAAVDSVGCTKKDIFHSMVVKDFVKRDYEYQQEFVKPLVSGELEQSYGASLSCWINR